MWTLVWGFVSNTATKECIAVVVLGLVSACLVLCQSLIPYCRRASVDEVGENPP